MLFAQAVLRTWAKVSSDLSLGNENNNNNNLYL